jgi:enediyne biosynthesis protein E4
VALLQNRTATANGWLGLELVGDGVKSNRNAIGARVEVETALGKQVRYLIGGGSYLSASERRVLVGLGAADRAVRVTVRWPSGREQVYADVAGRQWWRLTEGKGRPEPVVRKRRGE